MAADKKKLALILGLKPSEGDEPAGAESEEGGMKEQAVSDFIDCLGIDPKSVDREGLVAALEAFVKAVQESHGEE